MTTVQLASVVVNDNTPHSGLVQRVVVSLDDAPETDTVVCSTSSGDEVPGVAPAYCRLVISIELCPHRGPQGPTGTRIQCSCRAWADTAVCVELRRCFVSFRAPIPRRTLPRNLGSQLPYLVNAARYGPCTPPLNCHLLSCVLQNRCCWEPDTPGRMPGAGSHDHSIGPDLLDQALVHGCVLCGHRWPCLRIPELGALPLEGAPTRRPRRARWAS